MKLFLKNISLFLLPLWIALLFLVWIFFQARQTGEFDTVEHNSEIQRNNHGCLMGMGYNESTAYYKLLNADYYKAPVISLGTSRVMQFKKDFFLTDFYNCGGAVAGNYNEYKNFLENLAYTPETVIIGLDSWVFNDAWNRQVANWHGFKKIETVPRSILSISISIAKDWISKKWSARDLNRYPGNRGFNGRIKDEGFMYDGSYYYDYIYRDPTSSSDYQFANTLWRIQNNTSRFEWGEHIDGDTLVQLENLLSYCKEKNITVIAFLPPFAPTVYDAMEKSGNYQYLTEIVPACKKVFNSYGFEFFDFIDGAFLGSDDDFIDGFHGSEIVYARIIERMAAGGSCIGKYVDLGRIETLLENAYSGLVFFNPHHRKSVEE
ncbi:MAG: hypothetical protein II837_05270 [Treponema sp.]|nr:hypothetical protein [Treponema sp.]